MDDFNEISKGSDTTSYLKNCEKYWWKCESKERKKHFNLMRIQLLSPFLYSKVYQDETWVEWAKSGGLLSQNRTGALDALSDEELENTDLVEAAINSLQTEIDRHHKFSANADTPFFHETLVSIRNCKETARLEEALNTVKHVSWFKAVRERLKADSSLNADSLKQDTAVFLAAWQVTSYLLAISGGENFSDIYNQDSTLDESLTKRKEAGNIFYANGEYTKAMSEYTTILYGKPYLYIVYGNRAACSLKKKEYRSALTDGRRATALNPLWEKGQYRYALALYELGNNKAALKVLEKALLVCYNKEDLASFKSTIQGECKGISKSFKVYASKNNKEVNDKEDATIDSQWENIVHTCSDHNDCILPLDSEIDESDKFDSAPSLVSDSFNSTDEDNGINERARKVHVLLIKNDDSSGSSKCKKKSDIISKTNQLPRKNDDVDETINKRTPKRRKKKKRDKAQVPIDSLEQKKIDLQIVLKEGSVAMAEQCMHKAVQEYGKAVQILKDTTAKLMPEEDRIVLHYVYGVSYLEAGTRVDLVESMRIFAEINSSFVNITFPLAFYGIGRVYMKQNKFKEALLPLNQAMGNIQHCTTLRWPGIQKIIEESRPEVFKELLNSLLYRCFHPPKADAVCRFKDCKQCRTVIYFSDPDFKGFIRLICTAHCSVEFHSGCWRKYRAFDEGRSCDKDYLKDSCLTPDCYGIVNFIQIYDELSNTVKTEFHAHLEKKYKIPCVDKSKRLVPSSERGYMKKMKKYNLRLKKKEEVCRRMQVKNARNYNFIEETVMNGESNILKTSKETLNANSTLDSFQGELFALKNNAEEEILLKVEKSRKNRDITKNSKSKLTLEIPFTDNHSPNAKESWKHLNNFTFRPYDIDNTNSVVGDVDFDVYKNLIPDPKGTALHLFSMFEQILEQYGCADVHTSKDIIEFYNILDDNSKLLISTVGGLRTFLSKCNRFSFDEKHRSVVYLSCEEDLYKLTRGKTFKIKSNEPPPLCEEPLFVERLDFGKSGTRKSFSIAKAIMTESDLDIANDVTASIEIIGKNKKDKDLSPNSLSKTYAVSGVIPDLTTNIGETILEFPKGCHEENALSGVENFKSLTTFSCDLVEPVLVFNNEKQCEGEERVFGVGNALLQCESFEGNTGVLRNGNISLSIKGSSSKTLEISESEVENLQSRSLEEKPLLGKERMKDGYEFFVKNKHNNKGVMKEEKSARTSVEETIQSVDNNIPFSFGEQVNTTHELRDMISGCSSFCGVDAGVQVDLSCDNLRELKTRFENLRTLNAKLMGDLKRALETRREQEKKHFDDVQKENNKFSTMHDKLQNENSNSKKAVQKLRNELSAQKQSYEGQLKKMEFKKNELIASYQQRNNELEKILVSKDAEIHRLSGASVQMRVKQEREIADLEEIVQGLTTSQTQQSLRAQKVEIAFLEVKKEAVTSKFREQAMVVQNTIHQMQFWPPIPEAKEVRSIWEEYKKIFQAAYDNMQEEFNTLIIAVKDGHPLESMPIAKFTEPPPYPQTQMLQLQGLPLQVQAQQMQHMVTAARNVTELQPQDQELALQRPSQALSEQSTEQLLLKSQQQLDKNLTLPTVKNMAPTSGLHGNGCNNEPQSMGERLSTKSDRARISDRMMRRVVTKLNSLYPSYTRDELCCKALDYCCKHEVAGNVEVDDIVSKLSMDIKSTQKAQPQNNGKFKQAISANHSVRADGNNKPKAKIASGNQASSLGTGPSKRTKANHAPSKTVNTSWFDQQRHRSSPREELFEEGCIICFEDMTRESCLQLHCGHIFHRECIACWLNEQRTCPVCRVHALLPDEYPTLG